MIRQNVSYYVLYYVLYSSNILYMTESILAANATVQILVAKKDRSLVMCENINPK